MTPFAGIDTGRLLTRAMQVTQLNHKIIANNIANADTPHFNPTHLDFQKTLQMTLQGRGGTDLRTGRPRPYSVITRAPESAKLAILSKNDYNKVDLDDQVSKLAENTGKYIMYANLLRKRFEMTKGMLSGLDRA
jgi:flagellar basal-body rod protein FlgB